MTRLDHIPGARTAWRGLAAVMALTTAAAAQVTTFNDRDEWLAAVDGFEMITFTGYPNNTIITDQYLAEFGCEFSDGFDLINYVPSVYLDEFGLKGAPSTTVSFREPQNWIAIDHPGRAIIELSSQGQYLATVLGTLDIGIDFVGAISTQPFDEALILNPVFEQVAIDNLYVGVYCPADTDTSGMVDLTDLMNVLDDWGTDGQATDADVDGSGIVDVDDLIDVLLAWGACA